MTAATGMDALSHCLEAYCSPLFHPMAEGVALQGMRLIHDYLPQAVANGSDLEARLHMLVASTMGATAFQRGLGAMHALAHPLGALYDCHHGLLNAILMPYVLEANRTAIERPLSRLGRYLGLARCDARGCWNGFCACAKRSAFPTAWPRSAWMTARPSASRRWPNSTRRQPPTPSPSPARNIGSCSSGRCAGACESPCAVNGGQADNFQPAPSEPMSGASRPDALRRRPLRALMQNRMTVASASL